MLTFTYVITVKWCLTCRLYCEYKLFLFYFTLGERFLTTLYELIYLVEVGGDSPSVALFQHMV